MVLFLVAIVAVALLVLGLSITLLRTGHNIQGEVGENPNMRSLGLDCALKDEAHPQGCAADYSAQNCSTCSEPEGCKKQ